MIKKRDLFCTLVALLMYPVCGQARVFESINFESADVLANGDISNLGRVFRKVGNRRPAPTISTEESFSGNSSIVYTVPRAKKTKRSEHRFHKFGFGKKRYFGFSIFIPDDFEQPDQPASKIFWQAWQGSPWGPSISLKFRRSAAEDRNLVRTVLRLRNPDNTRTVRLPEITVWDDFLQKNRWSRIVIGTKPHYENKDSWIALWVDGREVIRVKNRIGHRPESRGGIKGFLPYMVAKSGLYQPKGNSYSKLFFDDIVISSSLVEALP